MPANKLSLKLGYFFLLLMAMFLFIAYRATMNAFLAVKVLKFPVNSYQDLLEASEDIIVWDGTMWEQQYTLAPPGSLFETIYKAKIQGKPAISDFGGFDKALGVVANGDAFYSGSTQRLMESKYYPCSVVAVPELVQV